MTTFVSRHEATPELGLEQLKALDLMAELAENIEANLHVARLQLSQVVMLAPPGFSAGNNLRDAADATNQLATLLQYFTQLN